MAISLTHTASEAAEPVDPDPGESTSNTNATRHLSAGAYLDPEFCLTALREIYYQPKRIVAPSYGFDPVTVLAHCLRARRALLGRDVLLLGILLLASWVSVLAVVVVLLTLLTVQVLLVTGRVCVDSVRFLRESTHPVDGADDEDDRQRILRQSREARSGDRQRRLRYRRLLLGHILALILGRLVGVALTYLAFLVTGTALAVLVWHADVAGGTRLGIGPAVAMAVLVALVFLVPALARGWARYQLRALVPDRVPQPPMRTRRLHDIDRQGGGNTVVYSGYQPFVGSGVVLRRWDLTQRLVRPAPPGVTKRSEAEREFETPPFSAREISAYVRRHIAGLATDPLPERHLSDLTVADRVFVAGTEISDLEPQTSKVQMNRIIRHPTAPQRHYLACQVVSWRGELVTTVYVHFAVQGKVLYVELHVTGLLPCDERYRVVDQVDGTSLSQVLRDTGHGLLAAPIAVAGAPVAFLRAVSDAVGLATTKPSTTARLRRGYDYGAAVGLREIGASEWTRDHMQTQDITKYGRMIERRVLDAILDFLEAKGVDVTEYRQRSLTILNAGAVATAGGTVNVSGDAVGTQTNTDGGND